MSRADPMLCFRQAADRGEGIAAMLVAALKAEGMTFEVAGYAMRINGWSM